MAVLAAASVFEVRAGGQYLFRNLVLRTSQVVIEPDGWFLSHLLAALVRDMGKARTLSDQERLDFEKIMGNLLSSREVQQGTLSDQGIAPVAIVDRQLPFEYTITSRSTDVVVPLPAAPAADSAANVLLEWNAIYDAYNEIAYLILDSMTPELHRQFENSSPYDMIKELKAMFEK
ncbi:hypothetical protein Tco_0652706 [Tanacetum coccineum]|uniref:Uncharacterized protein n=1 Tax=Tanacetum coccineum TaxID=301880 RepID=A0ABQ4WYG0_9ASTR